LTRAPNCPDCGSDRLAHLGALPAVPYFAGRPLAAALPGGALWRCRVCDLRFRYPLLADYRSLYDNANVQAWSSGPLRHDQRLVREVLEQGNCAGRLLDFGCYSGGFLAQLPQRFERFGVEVSAAAAAIARERAGAQVMGSLDAFAPALRFDAIVAMDVIEHVPSPMVLLQQLLSRLAPGGLLVLTTGDGGNLLWRLAGARWWYCYYPEHIGFISQRWLRFHAARIGCRVARVDTFNYLDEPRRGARRRWRDWLGYLLRPVRHAGKRARHLAEHGSDLGVPGIGLTRDHLLVQLSH